VQNRKAKGKWTKISGNTQKPTKTNISSDEKEIEKYV